MQANSPGVKCKNHIQVQQEKEKFRRRLFTSSIKREIKNFHVVVVK